MCSAPLVRALVLGLVTLAAPGSRAEVPFSVLGSLPVATSFIIGLEHTGSALQLVTTSEGWQSAAASPLSWTKAFDPTLVGVALAPESLATQVPGTGAYTLTGGLFGPTLYTFYLAPPAHIDLPIQTFVDAPRGLAVGGGLAYITSTDGALYELDPDGDGTPVPFSIAGGGALSTGAAAVEVGPDGRVNVLDTGAAAQRIARFDPGPKTFASGIPLATLTSSNVAFVVSSTGFVFVNDGAGTWGTIYDYASGDYVATYRGLDPDVVPGNGGKLSMGADASGGVYLTQGTGTKVEFLDSAPLKALMDAGTRIDTLGGDIVRTSLSGSGLRTVRGGGSLTHTGAGSYAAGMIVAQATTLVIPGSGRIDTPRLAIPGGLVPAEVRVLGSGAQRGVLAAGDVDALGSLVFDGGVLRARQDGEVFASDRVPLVTMEGGGAILDSNGFEMSVAVDIGGAGPLVKRGAGRVVLAGDSSYAGPTIVEQGTLAVDGSLASPVIVRTGGTLAGNGVVGAPVTVEPGGNLAPASSPGILATGDLALSGNFRVEIEDIAPGTGYDQLQVTGTVAIAGALFVTGAFVPSPGDAFTIIDNDGADAVTGTFTGSPEGATVVAASGARYAISYAGGDGNDVTLTFVEMGPPPLPPLPVAQPVPTLSALATALLALLLLAAARSARRPPGGK